jgi:hypothetical protein
MTARGKVGSFNPEPEATARFDHDAVAVGQLLALRALMWMI